MAKKLIKHYDDYLQALAETDQIVHNGERLIQKAKDAKIKKLLNKLNIPEADAKDTKVLREKHGLIITSYVDKGIEYIAICKIMSVAGLSEKDIVNKYLKGKR